MTATKTDERKLETRPASAAAADTDTAMVIGAGEAAFRMGVGSVVEVVEQLRDVDAVYVVGRRVVVDLASVVGTSTDLVFPSLTVVESGILS